MAEFASKGVAGAGLGLGIAGTALSLLNSGGGLLGGILGGGNMAAGGAALNALAEKDAKIAELTAQKYSDTQDAVLYAATRSENEKLESRLMNYITPLSQEAASNRERVAVLEAQRTSASETAELREKLLRAELGGRIDAVALSSGNGITQLTNAVAAINSTLGSITSTVVPKSAVCPEVMPRYNSWTAPTASGTASS